MPFTLCATMDLSVVILARDRAENLPQAIASVIAQTTNRRLDVIVAAHGSQVTASAAIVREYERRYDRPTSKLRFQFVSGETPAAALNSALQRTRTPYVAFLHADDRWDRFKIERQLTAIHVGRHAGLVHTGCVSDAAEADEDIVHAEDANDDQFSEQQSPASADQQGLCVGRCLDALLSGCSVAFSSALVRRTALDEATQAAESPRWFDEQKGVAFFEDMLFRLAERTQFVLVSEPLTIVHDSVTDDVATSIHELRDGLSARLSFMDHLDGRTAIDKDLVREQLSTHIFHRMRDAANHGRRLEAEQLIHLADDLTLRDDRFTLPDEPAATRPPIEETTLNASRAEAEPATDGSSDDTVADDDDMEDSGELVAATDRPDDPLDLSRSDDPAAPKRQEAAIYDSAPMVPPHNLFNRTVPGSYEPPPRKPPARGFMQRVRDWIVRFVGGSF